MTKAKEILKYLSLGYSQREVAKLLSASRNTISRVHNSFKNLGISYEEVKNISEEELQLKLFPKENRKTIYKVPNCDLIHEELKRAGVNLKLLWEEYVIQCTLNDEYPVGYTQFCNVYRTYTNKNKAVMHFHHTPGAKVEVDWAGTTIPIYISYNEIIKGYLFVGTLPYSQYSYVEVTDSMNQENWNESHANMFNYFKGVPAMIIPDNLKTGITKNPKEGEVVLNQSYEELANHYNTAVVPATPRTPRGKASVESTVGKVTTQMIARLRDRKFASIYEANQAVKEELEKFNNNPFQKRSGSRKSVFEEEEKSKLNQLPKIPYEYSVWKKATVQFNYHVSVEKNNYSVPYDYIKKQVDVRITRNMIEIYFNNNRVASHMRLKNIENQYSTKEDHMPPHHLKAIEWNGERFRKWAKQIGINTFKVVDKILVNSKIEQQGYKGCMSILNLTKKYSYEELESACEKALHHLNVPRFKNIKGLLEYSQLSKEKEIDNTGAILRYGGENDE